MASTSPKYRFKQRLEQEGRYPTFTHLRDSLKPMLMDAGVVEGDVWRIVSFAFPPLDGSPHEIHRSEKINDILIATGLDPNAKLYVKPTQEKVNCLEEFALDGTQWSVDGAAEESPRSPEIPADAVVIEAPPLPRNEHGYVLYRSGLKKGVKTVAAKLEDISESFRQLAGQVDRKKRCKPFDLIQWIFEYASVNPATIDPDEVPSVGSLRYLQLIQSSDAAYAEFMKTIYVKAIPDKKQLEHESMQSDDGSAQLRLLEQFNEDFARKMQARQEVA